jgi:hypothetical protein
VKCGLDGGQKVRNVAWTEDKKCEMWPGRRTKSVKCGLDGGQKVRNVARTLNTVTTRGKYRGAPTVSVSDRLTNCLQKLNHVLPPLIWLNNYRQLNLHNTCRRKQIPTFQKSNASPLHIS